MLRSPLLHFLIAGALLFEDFLQAGGDLFRRGTLNGSRAGGEGEGECRDGQREEEAGGT